jgi:UDP-N-acetylmuramoyl-L-alanyl-D-glutamate--2,6-diaminopimelate ligase
VRLHDLLSGVAVTAVQGDDVDVRIVVHDSRSVGPDALFCCVPGATADGHDFAPAAVTAGAVALLVEHALDLPVTQVIVPSVRAAMGPIAAACLGHPAHALRVVGVTGTNGKTTTTFIVDAIARAAGETTGMIGTVETRIGNQVLPPGRTTPEAPELQQLLATMRDAGVTSVAMEVSSHALDQHRVDGTRFAAACFTNLGHDHLDYHGTAEQYLASKERLFAPAFTDRAVVNIDDPQGPLVADHATAQGLQVVTYGVDGTTAAVRATDVRSDARGSSFVLSDARDGFTAAVRVHLPGAFNVSNALAAAAIARAAGLPDEAVVAGLDRRVVVPGRMERVDRGQDFTLLVDYAHTPDALERVLTAARPLAAPGGRVIVVFGCGGDRDRAKRPRMGAIAAALADIAILTSDNPRSESPRGIAGEVLAGVPGEHRMLVELDRRAAIRDAIAAAGHGDVVIVAGKGHEPGQTIGDETLPFDDRLVAGDELEALRCA